MFNPNQAFLLVQNLKSAPRAFTLGVKAELEKIFSICPELLLISAELYGLCIYGPKAENKNRDTIEFGRPICKPFGAKQQAQNAQSWPPSFFGLHSQCKVGLRYCKFPSFFVVPMFFFLSFTFTTPTRPIQNPKGILYVGLFLKVSRLFLLPSLWRKPNSFNLTKTI